MSRIYSDPSRANDKYSLPDVEVFYCPEGYLGLLDPDDSMSPPSEAGWYWWTCLPGCMPDSDPFGPFDTEEEAIADAQQDY